MYPSPGAYDEPSVRPGATAGLSSSNSAPVSQRTSSPRACCMAIRACACSTSPSVKQGMQ